MKSATSENKNHIGFNVFDRLPEADLVTKSPRCIASAVI